jgi:hypothetical protein
MTFYNCITGPTGKIIRTSFGPADERCLTFLPYGWEERALVNGAAATLRLCFIETDTLLVCFEREGAKANLRWEIPANLSREARRGRMQNWSEFSYGKNGDVGWVDLKGSPDDPWEVSLAFESNLQINEIDENGIEWDGDSGYYVVGFSTNVTDAIAIARKGYEKVEDPTVAYNRVKADWDEFFDSLPSPSPLIPEDLYHLAATALRMGLYAPRNYMTYSCSVPCKVHFNYFWLWDTSFQAIGQSLWSPELAKDNMLTLFQAQDPNGKVYHMVDDGLGKWSPEENISQPPVQFWAINKIYEKNGDKDFLREMYEHSSEYIDWWFRERDVDEDGLCEYHWGDVRLVGMIPFDIFLNQFP